MENFINHIHINNFKSIRDLRLDDCRRINLFIGYPNVGKSNVLEALGLFSVPYLEKGENLNRLVRAENKNELVYNAESKSFSVETDLEKIIFDSANSSLFLNTSFQSQIFYEFSPKLNLEGWGFGKSIGTGFNSEAAHNSNVKRYIFQIKNNWKFTGESQLRPPFGENIIDTLSYNNDVNDVNEWIKNEFAKNNLEYILDFNSNTLKIQKRLGNNKVFQLPYSSIADTLQRIIFYKTAIASNKNSILLFEEPEAHAFPPYIQTVMQDIIDAESNQFFIVTHSPLVVNAFLEYEKLRKETSIYLFDFKDNQTTAKRLSDEEIELAYEYGDDLFFNLENLL
jgi:AAA15 family ATPase/GTPase